MMMPRKNICRAIHAICKNLLRRISLICLLLSLPAFSAPMWAGAGFWDNDAFRLDFTINGEALYMTGGKTGSGTYDLTNKGNCNSFSLNKYTVNVWRNSGGNICSSYIGYKLLKEGQSEAEVKTIKGVWISNDNDNQVWGHNALNQTLDLSGLTAGYYLLQFWFYAEGDEWNGGCNSTFYLNNGNNDYAIRFYIAPKMQSAEVTAGFAAASVAVSSNGDGKYLAVNKADNSEQTLTADNGAIVINGLTEDTRYEYDIYALYGTEKSASAITISFSTLSNIAPGKTATASSGVNSAQAAIDSDMGTRWESEHSDPQWWRLDLGEVHTGVSTIEILWETACAKTFSIATSEDGTNYTEQAQCSRTWTVANREIITFATPVLARYIRFSGTERQTPYGYSFHDFRCNGKRQPPVINTVSAAVGFTGAVLTVEDALFTDSYQLMNADNTQVVTPQADNSIYLYDLQPNTTYQYSIVPVQDGVAMTALQHTVEFTTLNTNRALRAEASATGSNAANATDDKPSTAWTSGAVGTGDNQTQLPVLFTLDLKETLTDISAVEILWEGAYNTEQPDKIDRGAWSKNFALSYSADGNTWSVLCDVPDNDALPSLTQVLTFTNVDARYLRLELKECHNDAYGINICELRCNGDMPPMRLDGLQVADRGTESINLTVSGQGIEQFNIVCNGTESVGNYNVEDKLCITGLVPDFTNTIQVSAVDENGNISNPITLDVITHCNLSLDATVSDSLKTVSAVNDDNDGTMYAFKKGDTGESSSFLQMDLPAPKQITTVELLWEEAYSSHYELQASDNGTDWTTIKEVQQEIPVAFVTDKHYVQIVTLDQPVTTQYLRLQNRRHGHIGGYPAQLREWRVAGSCSLTIHYPVGAPEGAVCEFDGGTVEQPLHFMRRFTPGRWETLCLPFDVSRVEIYDGGFWQLEARTTTSGAGGHYYLRRFTAQAVSAELFADNWTTTTTTLPEKDVPYIIMFPEGDYYKDKWIRFVGTAQQTIDMAFAHNEAPDTEDRFSYYGNNTLVAQADMSLYKLSNDGWLFEHATGHTLYPTDCYILAREATMQRVRSISMRAGDNPSTEVPELTDNAPLQYVATEGGICIYASKAQALQLYSMSGQLMYAGELTAGSSVELPLQQGAYVLHTAEETIKLIL